MSICLKKIKENEIIHITKCKHAFHYKCIERAIDKNIMDCPLCRCNIKTGEKQLVNNIRNFNYNNDDRNSVLYNNRNLGYNNNYINIDYNNNRNLDYNNNDINLIYNDRNLYYNYNGSDRDLGNNNNDINLDYNNSFENFDYNIDIRNFYFRNYNPHPTNNIMNLIKSIPLNIIKFLIILIILIIFIPIKIIKVIINFMKTLIISIFDIIKAIIITIF